ncbi:unnamed protein product [Adineta steineri]|uniref:Uncharacterized protein n=2 Tax=Adineta steineri TaxID=433720 RepID=A0A815BRT6_9BILA|nr:unnamed protein product [Adineta steineri]
MRVKNIPSNIENNEEVRHWKQGDNKGELVVGGNGKGNQSNQLTCPASLSFDNEENRYVSLTPSPTSLNCVGLTIDKNGFIYVCDCKNEEVRHWKQGDNKGELVVGGNGKGNQSNQLTCPASLSFDNEENRYVVDNGNDRIQKYEKFSN